MEISINVHNVDLTPRLQSHVERKTGRLDRYMPDLTDVRVELAAENTRSANERQVAQITVRDNRGTILRAEERSNDMFAAVDQVVDKLYRQIKRYRGKRRKDRRSGGVEELVVGEPLPVEEAEELEEEGMELGIVRRKRFPLRPMAPDEAIEQMELLGHSFFVFFNADEEAIHVLYKRRDGSYGLIEPVFD
ncbi:MAG: ribosome-associated translation inhibitor RaiA [Chloroflexi bacterium]|nr:ribosome-associated translation inhibitor RaiA [Chloroflexota bacterium]MCI0578892.1 ribosome-associated translation inhibitor RaiA [Chloroflexota bacterium]MCI0649133.1 ribosome-associated translation inhibitor RaiA [Chloroflexota bacterium]MCI0727048.1 ribosome-associated translation inhibitor RaiA [Chloroflexota bacterium]